MQKSQPSVSVIITLLNESLSILNLLKSLVAQTNLPEEIIIVDGGSSDETLQIIQAFKKNHPKPGIKILEKKGNRSIGRNYAIKNAKNELIAITDAGCVPQKKWLDELIKKYLETHAPIIAGYYQGKASTQFEEAVIPYVLVMPDQVNEDTFLPATRSMLIEKKVWKTLKGFNENFSDNEDYEFAKRIKNAGYKISFARKAVVAWMPRSTLQQFFWMIFRFARGDVQTGIVRPKVIGIFLRYFLAFFIIISISPLFNLSVLFGFLILSIGVYSLWAVQKNYRYVGDAWYWLPVLQFTSDFAVLFGSVAGFLKK